MLNKKSSNRTPSQKFLFKVKYIETIMSFLGIIIGDEENPCHLVALTNFTFLTKLKTKHPGHQHHAFEIAVITQ